MRNIDSPLQVDFRFHGEGDTNLDGMQ